jgi:hypothetical protein
MIPQSVVHRLVAARHLFQVASEQVRSRRSVAAIVAVNLLQDAIEAFLLAATEHLKADVNDKTPFFELIRLVDAKLGQGHALPFKPRLLAINRMRVASKHQAITPNLDEQDRSLLAAREYFDEASLRVFGRPLWSISTADEIKRDDVRKHVQAAEKAFSAGDYKRTLISTRRAFYVAFEVLADINPNSGSQRRILNEVMYLGKCYPPDLPKDYVQTDVKEPFDYIVFDRAKLESDLRRDGIDPVVFDNIRMITPAVYFMGDKWLVRHDDALTDDDISGRAAYALEHVPDLILRRQARLSAMKPSPFGYGFLLKAKNGDAPVYRRATRCEDRIGTTAEIGEFLQAVAEVPSLGGTEDFFALISSDHMSYVYVLKEDVEEAQGDDLCEIYGDPSDDFEPNEASPSS